MRSSYAYILILTLISSGLYFYVTPAPLCSEVLRYRIEVFDERFDLTKPEALEALAAAEAVWEKPAGRELFAYDENGTFVINFIFDDRQERTIVEEAKRQALDRKEATSAEIATQYAKLRAEYTDLESQYKAKAAAYDKKLAAFNAKVEQYNSAGGAPKDVYDALQQEEKTLKALAQNLQVSSTELASSAKALNELSEQGNRVIEQYNAGVQNYNQEFGQPNEFTQGDYQGDKINIYKFSSQLELEKVLVHEFGHALGLGHVEGKSSMMYYLVADQPNTLAVSAEDMAAFRAQCENKTGLVYGYERFIRSIITFITNL